MKAICNICGKDYSESADSGGFRIKDKAICPLCAPAMFNELEFFDQENIVTEFCPKDESFSNFITNANE